MTLDEAIDTIERITYKPGWRLSVDPYRQAPSPALIIERPDWAIEYVPLPLVALRYMDTRQLVTWVFGKVRDIEMRRAEFEFTYAGQGIGKL